MGRENASLNDIHRLFIQAIISRRTVSDKLARILWRKCIQAVKTANPDLEVEEPEDDEGWERFETKLQDDLDPFDLEFKSITDELSGKKIYALLNRKGDDVAQLATNYTPVEIAYFKAVVEQIVYAPNTSYSLSALAALREVSFLKSGNMTKSQAENVLCSFVARGWLVRSKRGRYSLGSRTILELGKYLEENYKDELKECTICSEMVTKGIRCTTDNCHTFLHTHCHDIYKRTNQNCPSCNQSWGKTGSGIRIVGEKAAREHDDRRRARRSDTGDSDENPDDSIYDNTQSHGQSQSQSQSQPQSQSQSQPQSQSRSQKGRSRKKAANGRTKKRNSRIQSEDEEEDLTVADGEDDDAMDIDNGSEIEDEPAERSSRRRR